MNLFNSIRVKKPKRNNFNLSHEVKLTAKMGTLVPVFCQPVLPGDKFKVKTESLIRFAPLAAPMMQRVNVYIHYFFVPNRLVWSYWKEFITGQKVEYNGQEVDPAYPTFSFHIWPDSQWNGRFSKGSLADYLGMPVIDDYSPLKSSTGEILTKNVEVDALPFKAYQLIYDEYYRDQNLADPQNLELYQLGSIQVSNDLNEHFTALRQRAWEKDYFTSALPWPQKGDDVTIPIASMDAPLVSNLTVNGEPAASVELDEQYNDPTLVAPIDGEGIPNGALMATNGRTTVSGKGVRIGEFGQQYALLGNVKARLQDATLATINELRRAFKSQEFLERDARGGSRYIEVIKSHFGVTSSDARLQRPEYLGGGRQPVIVSEVLSTSQGSDFSIGTPAGTGFSTGQTMSFKRFFEEHGYIIGIMSIIPKAAYQQGMPRIFQKFDRFDYYWPTFAHLGEQEIKNSEIFYQANKSQDNATFGYQSRYSEYKYIPSRICGDFRDNMHNWHMGRLFGNLPTLSNQFIQVTNKDTDDVFAVTADTPETADIDKVWVQLYHNVKALRPMPKYGTPMF